MNRRAINSNECLKTAMRRIIRIIMYIGIKIYRAAAAPLYYLFRIFPLKNKVVATSFSGKKYGDNPQLIVEKLHEINPSIDLVWFKSILHKYDVPNYIRTVPIQDEVRRAYEMATARVWVDSHRVPSYAKKRKGQLFIETWHGGLGIKKLDGDVPKFIKDHVLMSQVRNTSKLADVFISNSDHLSRIYRSAFGYKGKIWKCGYPKNDIILSVGNDQARKVRDYFQLTEDVHILLYVPTFRDSVRTNGMFDMSVYDMDYEKVLSALQSLAVGCWCILVRFHPFLLNQPEINRVKGEYIINATKYPDIEELILSADAVISDYSSCIFDAAMRGIPCFTFATDFDEYKSDRGVYYEMEELPFPYARSNDELINNITVFNYDKYINKWNEFKKSTGLYETGHASMDIASVINEFLKGNTKPLEEIKSEP